MLSCLLSYLKGRVYACACVVLRFLSNRRRLKPKDFCKMIRSNIFTHFAVMTFEFYSNGWRNGGWGKLFRSADAYKHCLNIINSFLVLSRDFLQWLYTFFLSTDCVWKKSKCGLKLVSHETGDPCLKPRSFSQPQIFFQQFCFHEIRLTDKML